MGYQKKKPNKRYVLIEKRLLEADEWVLIGPAGRDMLIELKRNYNGYNNGELICTYSFMRKKYGYGFGTLSKAKNLLIQYGFIEITGRGMLAGLGGHKANRYKLTNKYERVIPGK